MPHLAPASFRRVAPLASGPHRPTKSGRSLENQSRHRRGLSDSTEDTLQVMKVIELLEDLDDVQDVYSNLQLSDEALAEFEAV